MTPASPPWCLHWQPSGELEPHDRHDLLLNLMRREAGWTQQALNLALFQPMAEPECRRPGLPVSSRR